MAITAKTRLVVLLGDPVSHSLSPLIHNLAFEAEELDLAYIAMRVKKELLGQAIAALQSLGFAGANLTIPHKQAAIPYLDELTDRARAVGAVNTIKFKSSGVDLPARLIGDNTDVAGFLSPLDVYREKLAGSSVLVWGSGGAARAVVFAAASELKATRVTIVSRSAEKGREIQSSIEQRSTTDIEVLPWDESAAAMAAADLLVNATPLGMTPHIDSTPCAHPGLLHSGQIVYDLVYNPLVTRLLEQTAEAGAVGISGLEMLIGQAAAAFKGWTGVEMPVALVREALKDRFMKRK